MTVHTATQAGGSDGFAAVLDGATSVAGDRSHDPGWYAEKLAHAIRENMPQGGPIADAVAEAIRMVRDAELLTPATTPTSTVALARWSRETVETYVLGDSYVVILYADGSETIHTDNRLDAVAVDERTAYRKGLTSGNGFDARHRALLLELQAEQARHCNWPGGYWIAGAQPEAAHSGITTREERAGAVALILASDGAEIDRHPEAESWWDLYREIIEQSARRTLHRIHRAEEVDSLGLRWPRSKLHDDKTLVAIELR